MATEATESHNPSPPVGVSSSEGLGHLAAAYRELNFALCGASLAMQQFADAGRRYVAWRGRRRMPAQLRRRGPRGRARMLKARRDSLGFVLVAQLAEFNHKSDDYEVLAVSTPAYVVHQAREAPRP